MRGEGGEGPYVQPLTEPTSRPGLHGGYGVRRSLKPFGKKETTGLRARDAVHVASAHTFQAASGRTIPFIPADIRQHEAAERLALNLIWDE